MANKKEAFVCPVRFYPSLKYGQNSQNALVNNENPNFSVFDYNLVLIPIHKTSTDHWALAVS